MKNKTALIRRAAFSALLLSASLSFSNICVATQPLQEKILLFPNEAGYGNLSKITVSNPLELRVQRAPLGIARGTVKVPANVRVYYEPGPRFFQNPQILLKLPPNSIDYIKMQFTPMGDGEERMSDHAVEYVAHLTGLRIVDFDKSDTSDAGAAKVAGMPNLIGLSSCESLITGTCLKSLSTCPKLEVMRLGSLQVSNESLRFLKDFKSLKRMDLNRAGLNSVGIQHLAACTNLLHLDISGNPKINGKDLSKLIALKKLKVINLRDTHVPIADIKAFANNRRITVIMPRMLAQYSKGDRDQIKTIHGDLLFDFDSKLVNPDMKTIFGTVNRK